MDSVVLENHVKLFVESKLGEEVGLQFRSSGVHVAPEEARGSSSLGAFWVRVIQSFYSGEVYEYKRSYNKSSASQTLAVTVEELKITVHLRTGLLTVQGTNAYGWFKVNFPTIMSHYDEKVGTTSLEYLKDQQKFDTRRQFQRKTKDFILTDDFDESGSSSKSDLISSEVLLTDEERDILEKGTGSNSSIRRHRSPSPLSQVTIRSTSSVSLQRSFPMALGSTTLRDGPSSVYHMWRTLLSKWFSDERGCKVYIVTPSIDVKRLQDIVGILLNNKETAALEALVCNPHKAKGTSLNQVKNDLSQGLYSDQQLFVEYKIFNKINYPKRFLQASFIAGLRSDGMAEVLTSSSEFTSEQFDLPCTVTVSYLSCTKEDFHRNFLSPLTDI